MTSIPNNFLLLLKIAYDNKLGDLAKNERRDTLAKREKINNSLKREIKELHKQGPFVEIEKIMKTFTKYFEGTPSDKKNVFTGINYTVGNILKTIKNLEENPNEFKALPDLKQNVSDLKQYINITLRNTVLMKGPLLGKNTFRDFLESCKPQVKKIETILSTLEQKKEAAYKAANYKPSPNVSYSDVDVSEDKNRPLSSSQMSGSTSTMSSTTSSSEPSQQSSSSSSSDLGTSIGIGENKGGQKTTQAHISGTSSAQVLSILESPPSSPGPNPRSNTLAPATTPVPPSPLKSSGRGGFSVTSFNFAQEAILPPTTFTSPQGESDKDNKGCLVPHQQRQTK